jgi:glycosyltransferase involved in cell wall biosynthesis
MELSIIIFCYNEEKNIHQVIQKAIDFLSQKRYSNSEIIIINDGSTDETASIIDSYKNSFIQTQHVYPNQGIGNALNTGYNLATKEYVCAIPGDGQFDIFEINHAPDFDNKHFVAFNRIQKNYGFYRSALTHFNQYFNQWILKIDIQDVNWIKIYKKEQIQAKYRTLNSSLVETEICAKLLKSGIRHIDLSSEYLERKFGDAKGGNWRTLKKAIAEIFQLYIAVKKFPPT